MERLAPSTALLAYTNCSQQLIKMKKRLFMLFILCIATKVGYAQIDTIKTLNNALVAGNLMLTSFKNGDYDTFLDLTHPKIIDKSGGRDRMKEMFKQGLGPGVIFISTELSLPKKLIIQDSIYQCAFTQKQVMSVDNQKFYTLGTLIGISYNAGGNWTFIGVAKNDLAKLQVHFPELSNELNVRTQTDPILINE